MSEKRKTTGQFYLDLMIQDNPEQYEAQEINTERLKKFHNHIVEAVNQAKKTYDGTYDFFVEVQFKKEHLTPNVDQYKVFARRTCPVPYFDQIVYRYNRAHDDVELLWAMPDAESALWLRDHILEIAADEKECLKTVLSYFDGTLMSLQADMNSELYRKERDDKRRKHF